VFFAPIAKLDDFIPTWKWRRGVAQDRRHDWDKRPQYRGKIDPAARRYAQVNILTNFID
jgi:hypothetical protein